MIKKTTILLFILIPTIIFSGIPPHPKVYYCNSISTQLNIDGDLNDEAWQNAEWTDMFVDIQGSTQPSPYYNTKAKMLWDDQYLYIGAWMEEPDIWANLTKNESIIYFDNDFEVFIDPDGDTHNYLEFEFNALNVWWDLYLSKPYRAGGIPMTGWTCNDKIVAVKNEGTINDPTGPADKYWSIEIAIPHRCVAEVLHGKYVKPEVEDVWRINFSRVQWKTHIVDGKYERIDSPEENWVWSPQGKIDMHMPEFWGYLVFQDDDSTTAITPYVDIDWETKFVLMHFYDAARLYHRNNGKYIQEIETLISIDKKYLNIVTVDIEKNRFLFSISKEQYTWYVDQTGKLWSEIN